MYFKIAIGNVKRSVKDYAIYFITITFSIAMFYAFNSIQSQTAFKVVDNSEGNIEKMIAQSMGLMSVFVAVVLGFLIIYANGF